MCKVSSSLHFVKTHSHGPPEGADETYWVPNTDVYVADGGLVIKVELAGMRREDLELVVEGNRVKISGQRPDGCRVNAFSRWGDAVPAQILPAVFTHPVGCPCGKQARADPDLTDARGTQRGADVLFDDLRGV